MIAVEISLKEYIEAIINERDKNYNTRFEEIKTGQSVALTAQKTAVDAAFLAAKEAVIKAEEAQRQYNITHNDILRKMDEQYKMMLPYAEANRRFEAVDEKIELLRTEIKDLQKTGAAQGGRQLGIKELGAYIFAAISMLTAIAGIVVAIVLHSLK